MKINLIVFLIIFSVLIIFPTANGQTPTEGTKQKSIEVKINSSGDVHVKHVIKPLDLPAQIDLIDGIKTNLIVKDKNENDVVFGSADENESIMIFPSDGFVIVEYDLLDQLLLKDNIWTWNFLYLESTIFLFPEEVDLVFVNERPTFLGEAEGITCHGCQMILEYSLDEPIQFEKIKIQDKEFLIETRTWAEFTPINFDPLEEKLKFEVLDKNKFVTITIPVALLSEPYQIFLDGEKIFSQDFFSNGTHVWLNIRPQDLGEVSITGLISPEIAEIINSQNNEFWFEYVVIGLIIIAIVIITVFFLKRKNDSTSS